MLRLLQRCSPRMLRLRQRGSPRMLRLFQRSSPGVLRLLQRCSPGMLRLFRGGSPGMLRLLQGCSPRMLGLCTLHRRDARELSWVDRSFCFCGRTALDETLDDAATEHGEGTLRHRFANSQCDDGSNRLVCLGIRARRSFGVLQQARDQRAFLSAEYALILYKSFGK